MVRASLPVPCDASPCIPSRAVGPRAEDNTPAPRAGSKSTAGGAAAKPRAPSRAPKPPKNSVANEAAQLPRAELVAVAKEAVRAVPGLRAVDLKKKLPKPLQRKHEEVRAILAELAAAGEVHRFVTAKAERFYAEDPIETLVRVVPEVLGKTGPLDLPALKRAVIAAAPGHEDPLAAWLKIAPSRGLLFEHAPEKKKGPKRFGATPDLDAVLAKALAEMEKAIEKTDAIGLPREQILDHLRQKLGLPSTPKQALSEQAISKQAPSRQALSEQASSDAGQVREALARLAAEDRPGALLLIEDLRRRSALDKARFDAAVLELSRQGGCVLHHHDHPAGLTEEERTALVHDGRGVYYHGVAPRSPS